MRYSQNLRNTLALIGSSYVENTLEKNHIFDAEGLVSQEPSREDRLKYWTNELCAKYPHTFDFAITVCLARLYSVLQLTKG